MSGSTSAPDGEARAAIQTVAVIRLGNEGQGIVGPLSDMGTHMFDVLTGLFGMPEMVCTKTAALTHDYAVEDSAAAIMTLAGGAQLIGRLRASLPRGVAD